MNDLTKQSITTEDLATLRKAKADMEQLSWAIRNINKIGNTLETGLKFVPPKVLTKLQKITEKTLMSLIKANLLTIQKNKEFQQPSNRTYKAVVTGSGALSGFFGSTSGLGTAIFASELALTTKFMMRSIMDIARSEGEDIYSLEGQLACLEVFALGGISKEDDDIDAGYYGTRVALSATLKNASASTVKATLETLVKSSSVMGSNAVGNFIHKIATRLSILLSEKFLAQAIPILGAAGGGTLNYVFVAHFQKMAMAHFAIRRLERKYGEVKVQGAYRNLRLESI